jgi:hypothetical protein
VASGDDSGGPAGTIYAEDRCALRWPLVLCSLLSLIVTIALITDCALEAVTTGSRFFLPTSSAISPFIAYWSYVCWSNWPTAIRVEPEGIRIGSVRGTVRQGARMLRPGTPLLPVRVYTCPWSAVRGIAVADRAALRPLVDQPAKHAGSGRRRPRSPGNRLGYLEAPFMRAALVILVDPGQAWYPPAKARKGRWGDRFVPHPSKVWLAPTRHPQALRAALERVPWCPPVADRVGPDGPLRGDEHAKLDE